MLASEQKSPQKMTISEYLSWEPQQELRYEYLNGELIAMTGGTIPHNDIALNFYSLLRPYLRKKGCRVNVSGVKVRDRQNNCYFYPDVVVTCNSQDLQAREFIENPQIYVLVDPESISVEIYQRGEGRLWLYSAYTEGEIIHLSSIGFECPIEQLYEAVMLEKRDNSNIPLG
ncbi:MAG: Uma2 family endonuclease [Snowella sp.]|nr:Uma2 family endonuclease [Snowella sp.]